MKKLLILSIVAMIAAVVNAAACSWTIAGATTASVKNGSVVWSVAGTSPMAYLILSSDVSAATTALDKGAMDTTLAKASVSTFNARGRFANVAIDLPSTSAEYSMVLVYTDKTDANKIWYQFSSATANASGSDDPMTPAIAASFGATTFSASGWTAATATAAVPEPTSGLLMFLGLAGLALKRKRA